MERVAAHLDTVTRRAEGRDRELGAAAARLEQLQRALADTEAENRRLGDTVSGQKAAILSLQAAVEADRRKEADPRHKHKTVRLIYKEHSDCSEDEAVMDRHGFSNNNNNNINNNDNDKDNNNHNHNRNRNHHHHHNNNNNNTNDSNSKNNNTPTQNNQHQPPQQHQQ